MSDYDYNASQPEYYLDDPTPNSQWLKKESGVESYYYLGSKYKTNHLIVDIRELGRCDLLKIQEDINNERTDSAIGTLMANYFQYYKSEKRPNSDFVTLPKTTFNFKPTDSSFPSRLVEFKVRDEFYVPDINLMNTLQDDLEKFIKSKQHYYDLKMAYKRGYLLYGPPGNGKTSFIRHATKELLADKCRIIWFDVIPPVSFIRHLCNSDVMTVFILEELTSYNKGSNVKAMLEFLDGESGLYNSIIIATTNYPEELQQNLADRPSRFDMVLEVGDPSPEISKKLYENYLGRSLGKNEVPLFGLTVAHIKEVCLLHKFHGWSLSTCRIAVLENREKFKRAFQKQSSTGYN